MGVGTVPNVMGENGGLVLEPVDRTKVGLEQQVQVGRHTRPYPGPVGSGWRPCWRRRWECWGRRIVVERG
jgi:hypothetical protein